MIPDWWTSRLLSREVFQPCREPVPPILRVRPPDSRVDPRPAPSCRPRPSVRASGPGHSQLGAEDIRQEGRRDADPIGAKVALSATGRHRLLGLRGEKRNLNLKHSNISLFTNLLACETGFFCRNHWNHERESVACPGYRQDAHAECLESQGLRLGRSPEARQQDCGGADVRRVSRDRRARR